MNFPLPYKVVYSIGGIKCKKCRAKIRVGQIQIAIMMQSDDDDCCYPEWYDQPCFFKTRLPSTEAAFDGFALLRYKDQMAIRKDLGLIETDECESETQTNTEPGLEMTAIPDFGIEYAKSSRDSCAGCKQKIKTLDIRIMKFVQTKTEKRCTDCVASEGKATWYHVLCFARLRSELNWWQSGEMLPGFKKLRSEDKQIVEDRIPSMRRDANVNDTSIDNMLSVDMVELEAQIKTQNEEYYNIYDQLSQNVSEEDQRNLFPFSSIFDIAKTEVLHVMTDALYFGGIPYCIRCYGVLFFDNTKYVCRTIQSWNRCHFQVDDPLRKPLTIPCYAFDKYPFLVSLIKEQAERKRVFHCFRTTDENGNDLVHGPYKKPVLFNMEFLLIGNLIMTKKEVERTIRKMGGKVSHQIHNKLAAIISTHEEVQKMDNAMAQAKEYNIQVVSENFLTEITNPETDPILYIISRSICDWGSDPYARIDDNNVATRRETIFYTKSLPEKVTYKCKEGTAVDPDCGLAENAHVYRGHCLNRIFTFSVILGFVDIQNNKNSYYRMQLLKSNELELYWVFESYGRISTVIGSKRLTNYGTFEEASKKFCEVYEEKTGTRFITVFKYTKKPNKFYHLDVEFGMPKEIKNASIKSKLSEPVFQLVQMLFDTKLMEKTMMSCDLDLKQMPLGKISQKQVHLAMETLKEIAHLIQQHAALGALQDASNKFYTLIPHAFGVARPPIIDSIEVVNAKNEMLESLLNMELIYNFLNEENEEAINPFDACYEKLKAEIVPLEKNSPEFNRLCEIVRNTHGSTHNLYKLEVLEIFKVNRDGEDERFKTIEQHYKNKNKALLWHGSRLSNFASILTNGLKVAPPEAPPTGYMFGKGIYFADVVSKSANYCFPDPSNNVGLMLMCEVALGNSRDVNFAQNITTIPNGVYQSVKANGLLVTTDWQTVDGLMTACGKLQRQNIQTSLNYNEYIVYKPAQVKIKYLFKMKFVYGQNVTR